jgi:hypothetical protein
MKQFIHNVEDKIQNYKRLLRSLLIEYIDTKAKCRHLKRLTCKGTLRQVFICLRPPPPPGFCLGWSSNFVGSEFGYRVLNFCRNRK